MKRERYFQDELWRMFVTYAYSSWQRCLHLSAVFFL